jgi:hypothetical protein
MRQQARFHGLDLALEGHFEHHLIEKIQMVTFGWYPDAPLFASFRSTKDFADTGEKFGIVPRVRAEQEEQLHEGGEVGREGQQAGPGEAENPDDPDQQEEPEEPEEEEAAAAAEDAARDEEEADGAMFVGLTPSARYVD